MADLYVQVSRRAMASEFEVRFADGLYPQGTQVALESLDLVEQLEEQLSFFRPESQLSRINLLAADEPIEVEPSLFALLQLAMTVSDETDGAYDITSTPLWETWGFARRKGQIPTSEQIAEARSLVGRSLVELDAERHTIRFRRPGVRINLGSIGKGHALDVGSKHLLASGMTDFLFHGGQSSVLAHGSQTPKPAEPKPWEVGIRHPEQPTRRLGIVRLDNRALGTSGGQFQSFRHHGRRFGHILDPRSGWPAESVLSATVVAKSAALADALSTAFYVMGPAASLAYCQKHPDIGMVMLCPEPNRGGIEIHTAGLGQNEFVVCSE